MLHIRQRPSILSLPPELWSLIGTHLLGDSSSLKTFAELNRHAFALINALLYQEITRPDALRTLALSQTHREQRIKARHPSAFVKRLHLDFRHPERVGDYDWVKLPLLERPFQQALSNIIEEACMGRDGKTPALTSFQLKCPVSFLQLFEDVDFSPFSFEMLSIQCLPPPDSKVCVDKWCGILKTMLKPSLQSLVFIVGDDASGKSPLSSCYSATIFRQIAHSAFNLQVLDLAVPGPSDDEADELIISTLNKTLNDIYFPHLISFTFRIHWGLLDAVELFDITPFLRRHSLLDYLHCDMSTVDHGYTLINSPLSSADLPELSGYRGLLHDYLTLCVDSRARKIRTLHLNQGQFLRPELEQRLIDCLEDLGGNLESLEFDGRSRMKRHRSPTWLDFALPPFTYERIFKACTNLARLACHINTGSLLAGFIYIVAKHLPNLEILSLNFVDTRRGCDFDEVKRVITEKILNELMIHSAVPSYLSVNCYYHSRRSLKMFVQATLENGVLVFGRIK